MTLSLDDLERLHREWSDGLPFALTGGLHVVMNALPSLIVTAREVETLRARVAELLEQRDSARADAAANADRLEWWQRSCDKEHARAESQTARAEKAEDERNAERARADRAETECATYRGMAEAQDEELAERTRTIGELRRERDAAIGRADAAEAKANQYVADWMEAKHEFGTKVKELARERDEARAALTEARREGLRAGVELAKELAKEHPLDLLYGWKNVDAALEEALAEVPNE